MIKVDTHNGYAEVEVKGNVVDLLADLSIINLTVLDRMADGNDTEMLVLLEGVCEIVKKAIKEKRVGNVKPNN